MSRSAFVEEEQQYKQKAGEQDESFGNGSLV